MIKNTLENKKKFAALYLDQNVLRYHSWKSVDTVTHSDNTNHRGHKVNIDAVNENSYLELKSLQNISDEDASHIAMLLVNWQESMSKLKPENIKVRGRIDGDHVWDELIMEFTGSFKYTVRYRGGDFMTWINSNGRCECNTSNHLQVYGYLRSKGYALPWMGISIKTMVEYGWVKLKEVK